MAGAPSQLVTMSKICAVCGHSIYRSQPGGSIGVRSRRAGWTSFFAHADCVVSTTHAHVLGDFDVTDLPLEGESRPPAG